MLLQINKNKAYMENDLFSAGVFLDLKNVFDTVDHVTLLHSLYQYRISDIMNDNHETRANCLVIFSQNRRNCNFNP